LLNVIYQKPTSQQKNIQSGHILRNNPRRHCSLCCRDFWNQEVNIDCFNSNFEHFG